MADGHSHRARFCWRFPPDIGKSDSFQNRNLKKRNFVGLFVPGITRLQWGYYRETFMGSCKCKLAKVLAEVMVNLAKLKEKSEQKNFFFSAVKNLIIICLSSGN